MYWCSHVLTQTHASDPYHAATVHRMHHSVRGYALVPCIAGTADGAWGYLRYRLRTLDSNQDCRVQSPVYCRLYECEMATRAGLATGTCPLSGVLC